MNADVAALLDLRPARRIPLRVQGLEGLDESAFLLPGVDLDVASIAYRQIGVAVLDLRSPSVLLGFQIGGIVGHKFLADRRVSFDLARSELRLSPPYTQRAGCESGRSCLKPEAWSLDAARNRRGPRAVSGRPASAGSRLEIVSDPERQLRLAELLAAAGGRKQQVLPLPVEQRLPRPVDVDGEAQGERLEADAVGRARIHQAQAADGLRRAEDRLLRDAGSSAGSR